MMFTKLTEKQENENILRFIANGIGAAYAALFLAVLIMAFLFFQFTYGRLSQEALQSRVEAVMLMNPDGTIGKGKE